MELIGLVEHNDELRALIAGIQGLAGEGLAGLFLGIDPGADPDSSRMAGWLLHALFIRIMAKWFLDPKQALTARELAAGLRIIAQRVLAAD